MILWEPGHRLEERHRLIAPHQAPRPSPGGTTSPGDLVAVPAGTLHNFRNTGVNPLVLYTVYGPAEHAAGAVHATKEEADAAEESGQDEPPVG